MFNNLSPIEQLDTVLTFMAETTNNGITINYLRSKLDLDKFKPANEIMGRLLKDGFVICNETEPFMGGIDTLYEITFDGRLFQSIGGYANQQKQIEETNLANVRNESQRATYERHLLYGTWFAGIAAALVLLWYIFVWFCPHPYDCLCQTLKK